MSHPAVVKCKVNGIANAGGTKIKPKLKPVYELLCTSDLSCTQGTLINEVGGEGLELEFYGYNRISSLKCISPESFQKYAHLKGFSK